jgi:WD40 repeat protein
MTSLTAKTKETSAITPRQKFEGHTRDVWGVVHLPGGQRIISCSFDGSLRVWNLKSGKQIGEDWRDGESKAKSKALSPNGKTVVSGKQTGQAWRDEDNRVWSIALSPDGTKVVSGSGDGAVRLWDMDTGKVIAKWMGHTDSVISVYWSRDGRRVLSGSKDGTVRQWDVEGETWDVKSGETILASIETGHEWVWAVVYSPDMSLIATAGRDRPWDKACNECSIQIWDAKTGKLVATLKGHTREVTCLAWTKDGKTLISGSYDYSIRTWNATKWEQIAILDEHTSLVLALAISPNDRILASTSLDNTTRLWNLDNGKPISSPLQHAMPVLCVSFSAGGKLLATGCRDKNAYLWDVAAIIKEAGLDKLLLHSKVSTSIARSTNPHSMYVTPSFKNHVVFNIHTLG